MPKVFIQIFLAVGLALLASMSVNVGSQERSSEARAEFKRLNPCPETNKRRGPCPGYVIDHIKAIACGGADDPSNMQWQTEPESKAKDGKERIGCTTNFKAQDANHTLPGCQQPATCSQLTSCTEAKRLLTQCGFNNLDRDGDGVPCESLCR